MTNNLEHFALPDLQSEVFLLLKQVPCGSVTTYGDLSRALGDEQTRSARWLGELLKNHPHDERCSCHRVVRSTGEVGHHISGDPERKAELLRSEGVLVSTTGHVDLSRRFTAFKSTRPLERLRSFQQQLSSRMRELPLSARPRTIAGVDVAYRNRDIACGAYVELDVISLDVVREVTLQMPVNFPYIPGYLTFRELPMILALCHKALETAPLADVLFVDGNGRLHPWRAGIATAAGVMLDHPTIGIGKSLLCGKVDLRGLDTRDERLIRDGDETIGLAMKSKKLSRPVYVSQGHKITMADMAALTRQTMTSHRVPEPIYWADRLTKIIKRPDHSRDPRSRKSESQ